MNATSLYVSTCRLVVQAKGDDPNSWSDLYRLLPYLRQSLSCTVCGNLLIEPHTPNESNCQHHVCKLCKGGKKKLKPSCSWCKDYEKYSENVQLRILLQCYKKLCEYITRTPIYRSLNSVVVTNGGSSSLTELVHEGTGLKDDYKSNTGLTKASYSILPCVYSTTSTSTQTQSTVVASSNTNPPETTASKSIPNGSSSLYSVMYGTDSTKITIKRKLPIERSTSSNESVDNDVNYKRTKIKTLKPKPKKKGCRCGNATPTPGKLTCCGQRCPCYVEAKACIECRCRGCRNPHRKDGKKVRPHIPQLQNIQLHVPMTTPQNIAPQTLTQATIQHHQLQPVTTHLIPAQTIQTQYVTATMPQTMTTLPITTPLGAQLSAAIPLHQVLNMNLVHPSSIYTTANMLSVQNVSSVVPAALLVGDEKSSSNSNSDNSDVDIDG